MEKLKKAKNIQPSNALNDPLSGAELHRQIGHRIRRPLNRILEHADLILSSDTPLPPKVSADIGFISGEAHQALELYDWVLALFELTLNPEIVSQIDSTAFLSSLCYEIEKSVPTELLGYRLIWTVPEALPSIVANASLLRRALYLMIQLLGNDLHSPYVQLDTQMTASELSIQTRTAITDATIVQTELEYMILDAVARNCGGRFEHILRDQGLSLTLILPIVL